MAETPRGPIWVLVEVEGEDPTVDRIHPGDTWNLTLRVRVPPGHYVAEQFIRRRLRITVPQEGVTPPPPVPWEESVTAPVSAPEPGPGDCPECGTSMRPAERFCRYCYWQPPGT